MTTTTIRLDPADAAEDLGGTAVLWRWLGHRAGHPIVIGLIVADPAILTPDTVTVVDHGAGVADVELTPDPAGLGTLTYWPATLVEVALEERFVELTVDVERRLIHLLEVAHEAGLLTVELLEDVTADLVVTWG